MRKKQVRIVRKLYAFFEESVEFYLQFKIFTQLLIQRDGGTAPAKSRQPVILNRPVPNSEHTCAKMRRTSLVYCFIPTFTKPLLAPCRRGFFYYEEDLKRFGKEVIPLVKEKEEALKKEGVLL